MRVEKVDALRVSAECEREERFVDWPVPRCGLQCDYKVKMNAGTSVVMHQRHKMKKYEAAEGIAAGI